MPSFPKPRLSFRYRTDVELRRLRAYRDTMPGRAIPSPDANRLRVATWNIANLGGQERREKDHRLLAELIGWFDIVAIQETKNKLTGIRGIQEHLPDSWSVLFSDTGGNNERMASLFDSAKVTQLEKIGEIAVAEYDQVMFFPRTKERSFTGNVGVFDFDSAVFRGLWDRGDCTPAGFRSYVRYFLSDHRPLWAELRTN